MDEREIVTRELNTIQSRRGELNAMRQQIDQEETDLQANEIYFRSWLQRLGETQAVLELDGAGPYAELTAVDAAELILRERGEQIKNGDLFDIARARGQRSTSAVNFGKSLGRREDLFYHPKHGFWGLVEWKDGTG
jgi:hypothetical protein